MNELGGRCSTKTGGGTASFEEVFEPNSAELKQLMPSCRDRICCPTRFVVLTADLL